MELKYIYSDQGQQEAVVIPIDFWKELVKSYDLLNKLKIQTKVKTTDKDIFSLFGAWQSPKTGEQIVNEIYSARKDQARDIEL